MSSGNGLSCWPETAKANGEIMIWPNACARSMEAQSTCDLQTSKSDSITFNCKSLTFLNLTFVLCHSMVIPTWFQCMLIYANAENFSPALTAPISWNTNTSAPPARTAARSPQKIPKTWRDADKETFHKSGLGRIWVDSRVLKKTGQAQIKWL